MNKLKKYLKRFFYEEKISESTTFFYHKYLTNELSL